MSFDITNEQLNHYFKTALADAEALVKATANLGGEELGSLRARAEESLRTLRTRAADAKAGVVAGARSTANATDAYVHDSPWEAIGVAAGIGLLIGVLVARR